MKTTNMKIKGFEASIHLPRKLKRIIRDGKEISQTLPPRNVQYVYPVDMYPACPDSWTGRRNSCPPQSTRRAVCARGTGCPPAAPPL